LGVYSSFPIPPELYPYEYQDCFRFGKTIFFPVLSGVFRLSGFSASRPKIILAVRKKLLTAQLKTFTF
jgi:hypothetical protein